jgi:large subunit ribosomal protein L9
MKVILTENVDALGLAGDVVNVKDGYARNYLIPKSRALPATPGNVKKMEQMRKKIDAFQAKSRHEAERLAQRIASLALTMTRQAGENEKLFGSVTSMDIERALHAQGVELDRKKILLEEPIKQLGVYQVPIKLHPEVTTEVEIRVEKE